MESGRTGIWHKIRAFTLVEMAVVLAIVAVVMAGIWAAVGSMNAGAKQQKFAELLNTIVQNVRSSYIGRGTIPTTLVPGAIGTGLMQELAVRNVFPGDIVRLVANGTSGCSVSGGCSVVDAPFGKKTTVGLPAAGTPYDSLYVCGWPATGGARCSFVSGTATTNVPLFAVEVLLSKDECLKAIMRNSNPALTPNLVAIYSNGTRRALPMTFTIAGQACANDVNYVDFVFRLQP